MTHSGTKNDLFIIKNTIMKKIIIMLFFMFLATISSIISSQQNIYKFGDDKKKVSVIAIN